MQEPTHILVGVIIQKSFTWKNHRALAFVIMAVLAFLSHGLLDKLANYTYHPANPDFHSMFWVSYHLAVLVATVVLLWLFWRPFKWGILFAMLPDIDWVFIHGQTILHLRLPFYQQPHLHNLLHWLYAQVPGLAFLDHVPNHRHDPWAVVWELLLVAFLLAGILLSERKNRNPRPGAP